MNSFRLTTRILLKPQCEGLGQRTRASSKRTKTTGPHPYRAKPRTAPSIVESPFSKGYAEVFAEIFNGEQLRKVRVCIDSGADTSSVSDEWVRVLRLKTQPTKETNISGVSGTITNDSCANFVLNIGGKDLDVHATVIPRLGAGLLVGINTLEKYKADILLSKRILKIGDREVPLVHRYEPDTIAKALATSDYKSFHKQATDLSVPLISFIAIVVLISIEYFSRKQTLNRKTKAGQKLSKEDFLYLLKLIDKEEVRDWSEYVSDDVWKEARWEAYRRKLDVDVILSEWLGCKVVTKSLLRWNEEKDELRAR